MAENFHVTDDRSFKCPSCGLSNPKGTSCRYCGAKTNKKSRLSTKRVFFSMIVLSVIGVGMVVYAQNEINRITPIGDITSDLDGETFQVSGTVIDMEYNRDYERIEFTIKDSSGIISLYGWSDYTTDLRSLDWYPSLGDIITTEARVDYREGSDYYDASLSMELFNINSLSNTYVTPSPMSVSEIGVQDIGKKISVVGNVTYKKVTYTSGKISFAIMELTQETAGGSKTIDIYMGEHLFWNEEPNFFFPNVTQTVKITGVVDMYNEEIEVIPTNITSAAIQIIEGAAL